MMHLNRYNDIKALKENPLFKDVSDEGLQELFFHSKQKTWTKRICFLDRSETVNNFYIITSGRLKVYFFNPKKDRKITLFILTQHDVFDLYNVFDWCHHEVYYETLDDTEVFSIPITFLKQWMQEHVAFYKNALEYSMIKMKGLEDYVTSSNLDSTSTRLAKLLVEHTNETTHKLELINGLPHKELAQLIGTTRTVLNRHIQEFKEEGIIEITNKNIKILNMNLLLDRIKK
ncbi:Crp/Fnr family transcriptional regulator [Tamlana sp. 2_MG-2023]|uniref:Crp/Fnr family transcriptional regulator n=1 Tax=unclassified Tamlana TaxID=2614803 RepID=UPI0026E2C26B|nr:MULTISPECIES: Crp/Fnr family transcriptional regulator [unclassified Tamlana]MDO6761486.1 Crp/Fnr family transcriptional regulator [Tamlana sp. 2_MG-2023]MDO6792339.1 Crp/Fnr family transcriptional regulator [Tamlana sp. 1_MG-2023]